MLLHQNQHAHRDNETAHIAPDAAQDIMTTAQAMEEELQQSVLRSESAHWETQEDIGHPSDANQARASVNGTIFIAPNGSARAHSTGHDDDTSDRDASGEDMDLNQLDVGDEEEDASGEDDLDMLQATHENVLAHLPGSNRQSQSDEDLDDADASGEDDDELAAAAHTQPGNEAGNLNQDEESDVSEAPSATDDDDDDEERASEEDDEEEEEEEDGVWEDARDMAEGEEEESETGPSNVCIFCKQDEEHDPSEDFEAYLACASCHENAHQQCAREVAAMSQDNNAKKWRCPTCYTEESDAEGVQGEVADGNDRPESRESDVPRMAKDLLAVPIGSDDGDAHSVFSELVLHEDPGDGSRLLRKRKTSSVEADEVSIAVRKRRRNMSTGTNQEEETADSVNPSEAGGPRSARVSRQKLSQPALVAVEKKTRTAMVMKMSVKPGNLKEILGRKRRGVRAAAGTTGQQQSRAPRRPAATPARVNAPPIPPPLMETPFAAESYAQPYYSFFDRDADDAKGKPYGGILADAEADTSKTLPGNDDRHRFDQAKQRAEDDWRARILAAHATAEAPARKQHKRVTDHASQIECIEFGGWEIDTWYAAPYPAEYSRNRVLYICEFCLKYMNSDYVAWRHKLKCATKHPPGDEIYRDGSVSMFEVDGRKNPEYCQNLCLLAKLFLGSKTLYYDVEPFLFYVLCEFDECGYHFVGYFSKEKRSSSQNNVSCILTLPIHQRKGYGNLLIDFSYLLTRVEEKTGSPEKPLSDMGLVSYRNYWRLVICQRFVDIVGGASYQQEGLSIDQISKQTGLTQDDVVSALEGLRALVRDPQTKTYAFRVDIEYCRDYVAKWQAKGYVKLKPEKLAWTPYVMGRGIATQFELGPISTIAPREDDEARIVEGPNSVGAESQPGLNGAMEHLPLLDEAESAVEGEQAAEHAEPVSEAVATGSPLKGDERMDNKDGSPTDKDEAIEEPPTNIVVEATHWKTPYEGILPSRFEIFPAISGGRRGDRFRQSLSRPSLPRAPSSVSRPRPKRPSGSARRPSAARPKANSSARRKTGGTGRGPGRWPKGTKKADYGNADSGPGFPPGWLDKQKSEGGGDVPPHDGHAGLAGENAVQVAQAPGPEQPPMDEVQVYVADAESNGGEAGKPRGEGEAGGIMA